MKILVTGGAGYVGNALTPALLADGHEVVVYDAMWFGNALTPADRLEVVEGDIREIAAVPMAGCDVVIHLANVANDPCAEIDPKLTWEVNTLATMRLAEKAIAGGVRQFIYASSGSVYGVKEEAEVTEELPLVPISDYNKTKMVSERVLLSYADRFILQCVRPATICGHSPRIRLDLSVNMLTMQALRNGRITLFGGEQTRPNIHLADMVRVYQHLLALGDRAPGIYNAGFENLSIREIAERITSRIPAEVVITESNDPRSYRLSSAKLLATGFEPRHSIDDAIRELQELYEAGNLEDDDQCYNIRTMKQLAEAGRLSVAA